MHGQTEYGARPADVRRIKPIRHGAEKTRGLVLPRKAIRPDRLHAQTHIGRLFESVRIEADVHRPRHAVPLLAADLVGRLIVNGSGLAGTVHSAVKQRRAVRGRRILAEPNRINRCFHATRHGGNAIPASRLARIRRIDRRSARDRRHRLKRAVRVFGARHAIGIGATDRRPRDRHRVIDTADRDAASHDHNQFRPLRRISLLF